MQTDHIRTFYMARMCDMHVVAWLEHHFPIWARHAARRRGAKEINN